MTRVATYARVSTDMQAEEGKSIAAQQAEMREHAASRGWEVVAEFVDPGYTGTDMNRPGLEALRAAAEGHSFDLVLVHELSRLSRRIFDTFRIFEDLGRLEIGFASVKEPNFDFSTPTGRLFLTLLAALNQYYVDILKMHTAKSKRERAREGLYNASITPFGYRHVGDANTPPEIVEEEAQAVREMYRRYAGGKWSYLEIADWINDAGFRTRSGRRFSKDTVADMLRNPFYKGYVLYRQGGRDQEEGELFPGKHEAIVEPELWEMCRQVREQRRSAPRTYQPKYRVYLLNGIISCDVCERKLRAQGGKAGSYYREMSRERGFLDCPFGGVGVQTRRVEEQVEAIFRQLRLPDDWQERLKELAGEEEAVQTLENRRARLEAERRRLKEMKIKGEFDEDLDIYEREQARIRRELAQLPGPTDVEHLGEAAAMLENLSQVWDVASLADRRDLLRLAMRDIKVDVQQGRVATLEPHPIFVPLFRQLPMLRELTFGIFVPVWPTERTAEMESLVVLPPLTEAPDPERAPDWPLVPVLPAELLGDRITPGVSAWLKGRREAGQGAGRVVAVGRPGVFPLRVDTRKWPGVTVERVREWGALRGDGVSYLWTPFLLQRSEAKATLAEEVGQVLAPDGVWAFVDVLPASMPGHWLYRFFPGAWENDEQRTWSAGRLHNVLVEAGFRAKMTRRTFHQGVTLEVAWAMARRREHCDALRVLPDELYAAGLAKLEEAVEREGGERVLESEFCLVEVTARRIGA